MEQLAFIEKIAFENGTVVKLDDLPQALRTEVLQYNAWTAEAGRVADEIAALEKQQKLLTYARSSAYSTIESLAQQIGVTPSEASTPTTNVEPASVVVEDVLQSGSESHS